MLKTRFRPEANWVWFESNRQAKSVCIFAIRLYDSSFWLVFFSWVLEFNGFTVTEKCKQMHFCGHDIQWYNVKETLRIGLPVYQLFFSPKNKVHPDWGLWDVLPQSESISTPVCRQSSNNGVKENEGMKHHQRKWGPSSTCLDMILHDSNICISYAY